MKNKELKIVRKKLDKLDLKILSLIKKRTSLVNQVIKIKKYKSKIVDKKRIKEVLKKIRLNSTKKKIGSGEDCKSASFIKILRLLISISSIIFFIFFLKRFNAPVDFKYLKLFINSTTSP